MIFHVALSSSSRHTVMWVTASDWLMIGQPGRGGSHACRFSTTKAGHVAGLFYFTNGWGGDVKLTEKQKRFVDYYIETGNGTEAAIKAGYSEKTARMMAAENMAKPYIREHIDSRIAVKDAERIAKQDEILEFLTSVMRGKVEEKIPLGLGMGEQQLVNKELDGKDRIKAAELLGKRYAMWTDNKQIDATVGVQIIDDIGDDDGED